MRQIKTFGEWETIPAPELSPTSIKTRLTAAGTIDVSNAKTITFDADAADAQLNTGSTASTTNYLTLSGNQSFAIHKDLETLYINQPCGYSLDQ